MQKSEITDFLTFRSIAEHGGFARAGTQLGVTTGAISQRLRRLETRLGVRLVNRTTRRVRLTAAGIRLAGELRVAFDQIERAASAVSALGDRATETLRLTLSMVAAELVIRPNLVAFRRLHPGIVLELSTNEQAADGVGDGFDAAIRRGDLVEAGMVSHRVGPDIRMLAVASPAYLAAAQPIRAPRDLQGHDCIRIRSIADGSVWPWRFEDAGSTVDVPVGGSLAVDTATLALAAALDGTGVAYLGSDYLAPSLRSGRLVPILEERAVTRPGFHVCYAADRPVSRPLVALTDLLKARAAE